MVHGVRGAICDITVMWAHMCVPECAHVEARDGC